MVVDRLLLLMSMFFFIDFAPLNGWFGLAISYIGRQQGHSLLLQNFHFVDTAVVVFDSNFL